MIRLEVENLCSKFLNFYDDAVRENLDPDARWTLWKKVYGFAAVPPIPERDSIARKMLDDCWHQYPSVIGRIRLGEEGIPAPQDMINRIAELFRCEEDMNIQMILYVGALEANAFTFAEPDGTLVVCLPVEHPRSWMELCMAHEFAHLVHMAASGLRLQWERATAVTILVEGIAMHTAAAMVPNRPVQEYTEHRAGWLDDCNRESTRIFAGIIPFLTEASSETVERFTVGRGTTGVEREAYYVGWHLTQYALDSGFTLAQLAHLNESQIIEFVTQKIHEMQSTPGNVANLAP